MSSASSGPLDRIPTAWKGVVAALVVALLAQTTLAGPALAQEPPAALDRPLADPAQESRARTLFAEVRCVVCQHESIADSPAGIAGDMRRLVREEIASGKTDDAVRQDLVRRWGDYILFRPPVRPGTWLLWFGPLAAALAAAVLIWSSLRGGRRSVDPLSDQEETRLQSLIEPKENGPDPDANRSHD